MIRDFNIEWLEARRYIPARAFQSFVTDAGIGAGAPVFAEVAATGISGVAMTDADTVSTLIDLYDVDITKQVRFRVIWTQSASTATDAATFIVLYTPIIVGNNTAGTLSPAGTVLIDPATVLNTAITALDLSYGVASTIQGTSFGIINRNTLLQTHEFIALSVELDAVTSFSGDEVVFLGLDMRYTPRRTAGPRRNVIGGRRLRVDYPQGVGLHTTQEGL